MVHELIASKAGPLMSECVMPIQEQRKRKRTEKDDGDDGDLDGADINLTMAEVLPRLVKAAQDQEGSRFLQWKLQGNCSAEDLGLAMRDHCFPKDSIFNRHIPWQPLHS